MIYVNLNFFQFPTITNVFKLKKLLKFNPIPFSKGLRFTYEFGLCEILQRGN